MKSARGGLAFSHLFYVDDLVLFAKVDLANCLTIREVLDDFCGKSSQTISEAKSRVYFSPNVDGDLRDSLCNTLGFQSTPNLGRYLRIPVTHPGPSSHDFNVVLDQVKQKLAGWKENLLSLAGRAVLVKHVSSTISNYVMQGTHLPKKITNAIDRVNRNFLWESSESARKTHWVSW